MSLSNLFGLGTAASPCELSLLVYQARQGLYTEGGGEHWDFPPPQLEFPP